jgi:D-lactate dehydrogenase
MDTKLDVFFYEAFEEEEQTLKRLLPPNLRAGFISSTIQEHSVDPQPPAPIISIRTQSEIPPEWAFNLQAVIARTTGYDHLKVYRDKTGSKLPCGYLPKYCSRAVAEHAMILWMSLLRKLPSQMEHFKNFDRDGLTGFECEGKTLLVVGVGNIGSEIVRIGTGLGMDVLGVDIVRRHSSVNYVPVEEGLRNADIVVCSMNLTSSNIGYFNSDRLRMFKRGALFINIARGEMSPPADIVRALDEGTLSGAGLDVYDHESALAVSLRAGKPSDDPTVQAVLKLTKRPNVILTPHNAFNTHESVERKSRQTLEQIAHFREHGVFLWQAPD